MPYELSDTSLHLFVDDHNLRNAIGFRRFFTKPQKLGRGLIFAPEGRTVFWGSVMKDAGDRIRLWYQDNADVLFHDMASSGTWGRGSDYGYYPERFEKAVPITQMTMIGYAHSTDGVNWKKPELGLIEVGGNRRNNYVLDGADAARQTDNALTNMDSVSVVLDEDAPSQERYNLIMHWETIRIYDNIISDLGRPEDDIRKMRGYRAKYIHTSPDGIHWSTHMRRIKECAGGGDYSGVVRDDRNRRWWFNDRAPQSERLDHHVRTAGLCQSDSLFCWPDAVRQVFPMTEFEDYSLKYEHHGMTPFNYGDQDLCYLEISVGGFPKAVVLGSHRDGGDWMLPNGKNFLMETGSIGMIDDIILLPCRNPPVRIGDKLFIYYTAVSTGGNMMSDGDRTWDTTGISYHIRANRLRRQYTISASVLRLDGFAGMAVDESYVRRFYRPAYLETQPLRVTQRDLILNMEHNGSARVSLCDVYGKTIPGYGFEDCLPMERDAVRGTVGWRDGRTLEPMFGEKIIVVIRAEAGRVYAVKI